jgi:hypothetical protein
MEGPKMKRIVDSIKLLSVISLLAMCALAQESALSLGTGWNLISIPVQPADKKISSVLSSIEGKYQAIYAYNTASGEYQSYTPGSSSNTLTELNAGNGYWIYMDQPASFSVNGSAASREINLVTGWNLAGYNSTQEADVAAALGAAAGKVSALYGFDNSANSYKGYVPGEENELTRLSPGRGYWIFTSENVKWTLPETSTPPTGPGPVAPGVVFDIDLTKGQSALPATAKVTGGSWENGWRVTGGTKAAPQRMVIDAGGPISHGTLEVSFTMNASPTVSKLKLNYAGMHENAHLSQNMEPFGDIIYARSGNATYRFSKFKAFVRKADHTEFEASVGATTDWVTDDKYVHNIKFQWGDGTATFTSPKGQTVTCPKTTCGQGPDLTIDKLRYVFLGSDEYTGNSLKGMRFLKVKLTNTGK